MPKRSFLNLTPFYPDIAYLHLDFYASFSACAYLFFKNSFFDLPIIADSTDANRMDWNDLYDAENLEKKREENIPNIRKKESSLRKLPYKIVTGGSDGRIRVWKPNKVCEVETGVV